MAFGQRSLCLALRAVLPQSVREDSKRVNPEQRKSAARQIPREFLEDLPN